MLAGSMLKLGGYGFLRFSLPYACIYFTPLIHHELHCHNLHVPTYPQRSCTGIVAPLQPVPDMLACMWQAQGKAC